MRVDAGWKPQRGQSCPVLVLVVPELVVSCIVLSIPVSFLALPLPGRTALRKQESRSPLGKRLDGGTVVRPPYVGATSCVDSFGIPQICTSAMATRT